MAFLSCEGRWSIYSTYATTSPASPRPQCGRRPPQHPPRLEAADEREQRAVDLARRRVEHDAQHGKGPPRRRLREPRRFHVDGQNACAGQHASLRAAHEVIDDATGPTRTRRIPRSASAATIGPLAQRVAPSGPRTSLATTTSPGRRPSSAAPQNPATATAAAGRRAATSAAARARAAPHATAHHERIGKTVPYGRPLDPHRGDDEQAGVQGVHAGRCRPPTPFSLGGLTRARQG